jgi:hypothetical protein
VSSESGHKVAECPEPPNPANMECRKCNESKYSHIKHFECIGTNESNQWATWPRIVLRAVVVVLATTVARKDTFRRSVTSLATLPT